MTLAKSLSGLCVPSDKDIGGEEKRWNRAHRAFRSRQKELRELGVKRGFQVEF